MAMSYGPGGMSLSPTPRLSNRIVRNRDERIGVSRCHHTWVAPRPMMRSSGSPLPSSVQNRRVPFRVANIRLQTSDFLLLSVVLVVGRLLQPFDLAAEADRDLHEAIAGRGAVPVDDVRSGVVALAKRELLHRLPLLLRPRASLLDEDQLSLVVAVPGGARAGLEAPAADAEILGLHRVGLAGE